MTRLLRRGLRGNLRTSHYFPIYLLIALFVLVSVSKSRIDSPDNSVLTQRPCCSAAQFSISRARHSANPANVTLPSTRLKPLLQLQPLFINNKPALQQLQARASKQKALLRCRMYQGDHFLSKPGSSLPCDRRLCAQWRPLPPPPDHTM